WFQPGTVFADNESVDGQFFRHRMNRKLEPLCQQHLQHSLKLSTYWLEIPLSRGQHVWKHIRRRFSFNLEEVLQDGRVALNLSERNAVRLCDYAEKIIASRHSAARKDLKAVWSSPGKGFYRCDFKRQRALVCRCGRLCLCEGDRTNWGNSGTEQEC